MLKKTRIQFDLPENKVKELDDLMAATDSETRRELFNNALTLLQWAIQQRQLGYEIGAYHRIDKDLHILTMPALSNVEVVKKGSGWNADDTGNIEVTPRTAIQ